MVAVASSYVILALHDASFVLVGDDPASATYVKMKGNACKRVGMESIRIVLEADTTTEQLIEEIQQLNTNPDVHGILLQHPVPAQINERLCFDSIALEKDVDGVTSLGFGKMAMQEFAYGSATPAGIISILEAYDIDPGGKHAVVIGRSAILGKPMAMMLLNKNATVTICHSRTENLAHIIAEADVVVAAVGARRPAPRDGVRPARPAPGPRRESREDPRRRPFRPGSH